MRILVNKTESHFPQDYGIAAGQVYIVLIAEKDSAQDWYLVETDREIDGVFDSTAHGVTRQYVSPEFKGFKRKMKAMWIKAKNCTVLPESLNNISVKHLLSNE